MSTISDEQFKHIESMLEEVLGRVGHLEVQIDRMQGVYEALGSVAAGLPPRLLGALHAMSPREHVAMQMVLEKRSNHEIAVCLELREPDAARIVSDVATHIGVNGRQGIRDRMIPAMEVISEEEYRKASGGLPKNWNDKYGVGDVPDPYRSIYFDG